MKLTLTKKAGKKIEKLMLDAEYHEIEAKRYQENANKSRNAVKADMFENGVKEYIVDDDVENDKVLKASLYTKQSVKYDLEAIKNKLSKEQRKLVTNSLMVAEQDGLKAFIKAHPELKSELTTFVRKVDVIDERKLSLAIEYGNVSLDDISGCYSVDESDVFKMQRVKRFELLE